MSLIDCCNRNKWLASCMYGTCKHDRSCNHYWCFLKEEPWSGNKWSAKWWGEREKRWENLWLPATVNWSYCANRFELGSRSDPISWLGEPYSVLWLAVANWQVCCYWLVVNWSHDVDCHMIVRFASPATKGFLSLLWVKENLWDQGNLKQNLTNTQNLHQECHVHNRPFAAKGHMTYLALHE